MSCPLVPSPNLSITPTHQVHVRRNDGSIPAPAPLSISAPPPTPPIDPPKAEAKAEKGGARQAKGKRADTASGGERVGAQFALRDASVPQMH